MLDETPKIAANPSTSPEILRELSQHELMEVRQAVAMNPNTPIETLWELVADYPNEILQNSEFTLIQLENPDWILGIPEGNLVRLLCRSDIEVPNLFIENSSKLRSQPVLSALRTQINYNTKLTSIQLERLALQWDSPEKPLEFPPLLDNIIHHPNITFESLKRISAQCNSLSQQRLVGYCLDDKYHLPESLPLSREELSDGLLSSLITNTFEEWAIHNILIQDTLPRRYIWQLLEKASFTLSTRLAKLKSTNTNVLEYLYKKHLLELEQGNHSINDKIRLSNALIKNSQTPNCIIQNLANSPYKAVRAQVARQIALPSDLFIKLAQDDYPRTRLSLLANRKISPHLLLKLTRHPNPIVSQLAKQHPNTPKAAK